MQCIKENNLKSEILFVNENAAIVNVVSYEESVILGAESCWCISQHKCSWDQYVLKPQGVQLFFYCFDKPVHNYGSLYGATFKVKGDSVITDCCFTRDNNPISKVEKFDTDEEALFTTVIEPRFGNIKDELFDIIYDIQKETYKPKPKPKAKQKATEHKVSLDLETEGLNDLNFNCNPLDLLLYNAPATTYTYSSDFDAYDYFIDDNWWRKDE